MVQDLKLRTMKHLFPIAETHMNHKCLRIRYKIRNKGIRHNLRLDGLMSKKYGRLKPFNIANKSMEEVRMKRYKEI